MTIPQPNVLCSTSHNFIYPVFKGDIHTFMTRIRVQRPADHWRVGFTNQVDSTWDDGSLSFANLPGASMRILSAAFACGNNFFSVTFQGQPSITVPSCAQILSDVCPARVQNGYLEFHWCVEALSDGVLPATPDSQALCWHTPGDRTFSPADSLPSALELSPPNLCVLPDLFEAEGEALPKMVFLGDSITQGCGTRIDLYESWAARIAAAFSEKYAALNIGLGFARLRDAASDGCWLKRARDADIVNVCLGVNDILQNQDTAQTSVSNLQKIVSCLKTAPRHPRVVLFTVPAFDYEGENIEKWNFINAAIRAPGHLGADHVFEMALYSSQGPDAPHKSRYGSHPDGIGGEAIARAYVEEFAPGNCI